MEIICRAMKLKNAVVCVGVGILLGFFSAFLGIGRRPINLMVLSYFFSMDTKEAAINSLFVILVSRIFSLMQTILSGNVPEIEILFLVLMVIGGVMGGKAGSRVNKRIQEKQVNRLFEGLKVLIIFICVYNMYGFR